MLSVAYEATAPGATWNDPNDVVRPLPFAPSNSFALSKWPVDLRFAESRRREDLICLWLRAIEMITRGSCSLAQARDLATDSIESQHEYAEQTVRKMIGTINRFFRFAEVAYGISSVHELTDEIVEEFIWARRTHGGRIVEVSPKTARNRRSFVRTAFADLRSLGIPVPDELVGPSITFDPSAVARALTDQELKRVRAFATGSLITTRRPLLVALSEAGGSASEIAEVRFADLDLDAGTVEFRGSAPRTNPLSAWGTDAAGAWAMNVEVIPDGRLCVDDRLLLPKATQSITSALTKVIREAGFGHLPDVSPRSIRLTFAERILNRDGIVAAARFLGSESLDSIASALRFDWQCR
jgi:integrase